MINSITIVAIGRKLINILSILKKISSQRMENPHALPTFNRQSKLLTIIKIVFNFDIRYLDHGVINDYTLKSIDLKKFSPDNDAVYNEVLQRNQETAQKAITSALADSNAGTIIILFNTNFIFIILLNLVWIDLYTYFCRRQK